MRLTFNADHNSAMADLERAAADLARWQRAVSSGRRIQVASDDPAAMARVISERAELGSIDRYVRAVDSVSSRLSIVDTVVSDVITRITDARATAAGARGSVPTPSQREAAAQALLGAKDALLADLNYTFRGIHLFSGSSTTTAPYVKQPDGTVSAYQGDAQPVSVDVDRARAVAVNFDGQALAQGSEAADIFANLDALVAAVRAGDDAGIQTGLEQLERAFDRAVGFQSSIGTQLAGLDDQRSRLSELKQASTALVSKDEDANMAEAVSRMTQAETAYRTALAAIGNQSRLTLLDYLR
jgi:flagellar hook-associated protein 3 FlgL